MPNWHEVAARVFPDTWSYCAVHVEVAPDLGLGTEAFSIYGQRYGDWRLDSPVADMEVARFEAEHLVMSGRYDTVRVVIESGPALGSPAAHRILFTAQGDPTGSAVMAREARRPSPPSGRVVVSLPALAGVLFAAIYAAAGNLYRAPDLPVRSRAHAVESARLSSHTPKRPWPALGCGQPGERTWSTSQSTARLSDSRGP
jgi:hypothetical protein